MYANFKKGLLDSLEYAKTEGSVFVESLEDLKKAFDDHKNESPVSPTSTMKRGEVQPILCVLGKDYINPLDLIKGNLPDTIGGSE